jgi:hypothetical protein
VPKDRKKEFSALYAELGVEEGTGNGGGGAGDGSDSDDMDDVDGGVPDGRPRTKTVNYWLCVDRVVDVTLRYDSVFGLIQKVSDLSPLRDLASTDAMHPQSHHSQCGAVW